MSQVRKTSLPPIIHNGNGTSSRKASSCAPKWAVPIRKSSQHSDALPKISNQSQQPFSSPKKITESSEAADDMRRKPSNGQVWKISQQKELCSRMRKEFPRLSISKDSRAKHDSSFEDLIGSRTANTKSGRTRKLTHANIGPFHNGVVHCITSGGSDEQTAKTASDQGACCRRKSVTMERRREFSTATRQAAEEKRRDEQKSRKISQIEQIATNSADLQHMIGLLDETLERDDSARRLGAESTCSSISLNGFTPPPQYQLDYGKNLEKFSCEGREFDENSSAYRPKRCWCYRCQIMYRMHQEGDESLVMWGNYPCHQF